MACVSALQQYVTCTPNYTHLSCMWSREPRSLLHYMFLFHNEPHVYRGWHVWNQMLNYRAVFGIPWKRPLSEDGSIYCSSPVCIIFHNLLLTDVPPPCALMHPCTILDAGFETVSWLKVAPSPQWGHSVQDLMNPPHLCFLKTFYTSSQHWLVAN